MTLVKKHFSKDTDSLVSCRDPQDDLQDGDKRGHAWSATAPSSNGPGVD